MGFTTPSSMRTALQSIESIQVQFWDFFTCHPAKYTGLPIKHTRRNTFLPLYLVQGWFICFKIWQGFEHCPVCAVSLLPQWIIIMCQLIIAYNILWWLHAFLGFQLYHACMNTSATQARQTIVDIIVRSIEVISMRACYEREFKFWFKGHSFMWGLPLSTTLYIRCDHRLAPRQWVSSHHA